MTTGTDPWAPDAAPPAAAPRLVFLDTETTGLETDADVWDFAAIIRDPGEKDVEVQFFIEHDETKAARLPEPFLSDYRTRYNPAAAITREEAASRVVSITNGAHVIGAVPSFDTERLSRLIVTVDLAEPDRGGSAPWHYHLIDVESLAVGFLAGVCRLGGASADADRAFSWLTGAPLPPWESDVLSRAVGVEPPKQGEGRHTALGDTRWCRDVFDAVMVGPEPEGGPL